MKIISGHNITYDHIRQALELDAKYYPVDYRLSFDQCREYFDANGEIYFMLTEGDCVLGYLNFSPITDAAYEALLSGRSTDICLKGEDITPYSGKGAYNGYFSSIVIDESIRRQGYANLLLKELQAKLAELKGRGIIFKRIVADVLNEGGAAIVSKLGMNPVRRSQNNSVIYEAIFDN